MVPHLECPVRGHIFKYLIRNCLGRSPQRWSVLCRVRRKFQSTQGINPDIINSDYLLTKFVSWYKVTRIHFLRVIKVVDLHLQTIINACPVMNYKWVCWVLKTRIQPIQEHCASLCIIFMRCLCMYMYTVVVDQIHKFHFRSKPKPNVVINSQLCCKVLRHFMILWDKDGCRFVLWSALSKLWSDNQVKFITEATDGSRAAGNCCEIGSGDWQFLEFHRLI